MEMEAKHWFSQRRHGHILIIVTGGQFQTWESIRDHLLPPSIKNNLTGEPLWVALQHRREQIQDNPDRDQLREEIVEDLKQIPFPSRICG
jgi:hypothetical protein